MSSYIQNLGDNSDTIILPIVDHADASSLDIDGSSNGDDENTAINSNNNNTINVDGNDNDNDNPPSTSTTSTTKLRLIELGCCFIPVPIGILLEFIFNPYKRRIPFQILDESSSGEYIILNQMYNLKEPDNETVSPLLMVLCALVLPFCFQLLIICRNKRKYHHRYHQHQHHQQQQQQQHDDDDDDDNDDNDDIHKTICVYLLSIGLTQSLTNIAKLYCGYLRPIFYEMCQPNINNEEDNSSSDEQQFQCEGNQERQSRLSFPSGHASFSVCGLLVFSYYLERVYGISHSYYNSKNNNRNMNNNNNINNNNNNNNTTTTATSSRRRRHLPIQLVRIVSIVCYTPMLLAFFICISRVHDNFHHPADIIGGALLGGSIATIVFNTWFP